MELTRFFRVKKMAEKAGWIGYDDEFFEDAWRYEVIRAFWEEFDDADHHSELHQAYQDDFNEQKKNKLINN